MEQRFEEILDLAIKSKSTDIHITLEMHKAKIELRGIDGLTKLKSKDDDDKLFHYLMYQSRLDITSKVPQSGSFQYFFKGSYYDFRFSIIVTEKIATGVLRILNCHNGLPLERITFEQEMQKRLFKTIQNKNGLILFTGPTGSGKTTTMYSLLKMVKNRTIYSLEDPIETVQDNIIQLEVNEKKGFGFMEGIRQMLRHNPDILMIGEIRDELTAKMAIRAALTGCLVVSSLHSASTIGSLHRLMDLGCNKEDLMDCCRMIFNQRLVKLRGKKEYTCVFDCLDNDGVLQYFNNGLRSEDISDRVQQAIEKGFIEDDES